MLIAHEWLPRFVQMILDPFARLLFKTPTQGAQTSLFCALDSKVGLGLLSFSALLTCALCAVASLQAVPGAYHADCKLATTSRYDVLLLSCAQC